MANEITALRQVRDEVQLLFLYPVATPKTFVDGLGVTRNVAPTPSSGLPDEAQDILTAAEKTALDAGTLVFVVASFRNSSRLTGAALATKAKALYDAHLARATELYQSTFEFFGSRINR